MTVVSFGAYEFKYVKQFRTNFNNGTPVTTKLPFAFGTWAETGQSALPSEQAMVEVGTTLAAWSKEEMDGLRDEVKAMRSWGLQKLVYQPSDPADGERYTWGVVNNISIPQREDNHTNYFQDVTIQFYCPYPFWMGGEYEGLLAGDPSLIADSALYFGEGALVIPCAGLETLTTVTNNGNAPAVCIFTIAPPSGESCQNPIIQRIVNDVVVDGVGYNGILTDADSLEGNGFAQWIGLNGANAFADSDWLHPNLLRLMPGENSLRIKFTNAGDEADLRLFFPDTWS